jgi:hypothetical protein
MIFPIPKKETYSDGRYAVAADLASLSLVDLFAAVKDGKAEIAISVDSALAGFNIDDLSKLYKGELIHEKNHGDSSLCCNGAFRTCSRWLWRKRRNT